MKVYVLMLAAVAFTSVKIAESKPSQLEELLGTQQLDKPGPQLGCIVEHCLTQSVACVEDSNCLNSLKCAKKCLDSWDNDTTKEKLHVQNCTNKCAFSYADEAYEKLMTCYTNYQCISFPPIPSYCRANATTKMLKQLSIKDLAEHSWWVVRGLNSVYDCYPCQTIQFNQINSTFWDYNPLYQVYLVNGSLKLVNQHMTIGSQPPGANNVSFVYHDVGLKHTETWWLLDEAEDKSYFAMYYCGSTLQWNYEGALVLSRNRTLGDAAYQKISAAYKSVVGHDLSEFCNIDTSERCPNKPGHM